MRALKGVDHVVLSIDKDPSVTHTLDMIAGQHPGDTLIFANGGDRNTTSEIPETEVCMKHNIHLVFGVGGAEKYDSSTRINRETGHEKY